MRDAYARHFEPCLIKTMQHVCPDFRYMDGSVRRKLGKPVWYGPGKLIGFCWTPAGASTLFVIVFRTPNGQDSFEAGCEWSASGKVVEEQPLLHDKLFDAVVLHQPHARTLIQSLSRASGDPPEARVVFWDFWKPGADRMDTDRWFRETMEEASRTLPDDEAQARVEATVIKAVADVKRLVLPWFAAKREMAPNTWMVER